MEGVTAAVADMNQHTVTVTFDDAQASLDAIEKALHDAGYTTGEPMKQ